MISTLAQNLHDIHFGVWEGPVTHDCQIEQNATVYAGFLDKVMPEMEVSE